MEQDIRAAVELLRQAQHVAVLTGAGISAESGIPTFRDALTGLWERFDAAELATADAYRRDRELVWGWYEWRRMKALQAQPNAGHLALAALAQAVPNFTLITQNVDDLHERADNQNVLHLHGSLHTPRCFACARPHALPEGLPDEPEGGRRLAPPVCLHCAGAIRPGVVWFNESLPQPVWHAAERAVKECDLLLVIGTSGLVYPAAGLPELAQRLNKSIVVINPISTPQDRMATLTLRGTAGKILPALSFS